MFALLLVLLAAFALATDVPTTVKDAGCQEINNVASCCAYEDIGFINIDACANIEIDWTTLDITFSLTLNGVVLFDTTFGFDTPPALCADIFGMNICVGFTNMDLTDWVLSGCISLVIDGKKSIELGCFTLGQ